MKKSLVAIAALTLVGAASAQVTLTGNVSFSYQNSMSGPGAVGTSGAKGIAMSDNSIFLGDTEDLGGGTKLIMSTGFDAGGRKTIGIGNFSQEDSSLKVVGGFGSVTLKSFESDGAFAPIEGLSGASVDVGMFDSSAVGPGKRFRNGVSYSTPSFSGFTGSLSYVTLAGQYANSASQDAKTKTVPAITYANGPLTVYAEYDLLNASYNNNTDDTVTQPYVTVKYDFGVATVGAGWTKPSNDGTSYILGLSVPVGALTFGLATTTYNAQTSASTDAAKTSALINANGSAQWTEASISYALSKRTSLKASFAQTNDAGVAYANAGNAAAYGLTNTLVQNNETRVGLFHSF